MNDWHLLDAGSVIQALSTDFSRGLDETEAARRVAEYGPNTLRDTGGKSPWHIAWEQIRAVMILVLIASAVISAFLGDTTDAAAIAVIVVLNAVLGFSQEYRAEKAISALNKLAVPFVKVRREGMIRQIRASDLVPGDVVLLEAGNIVPADCRILESAALQTQESALTGESEPIRKITDPLTDPNLLVADRRNMAYMGTAITSGRGQAIVTATGPQTELGQIATMIQRVEHEPTPLQRRLDQLGKRLAFAALLLVGIIFVLGLVRGEGLRLLFLTAVSIGVAAVPEGLPAVVTIALSLGAQRLLKRRALIRRLAAVETLGSVTVICSDKTGTLTENRMTAAKLQLADGRSVDPSSILTVREGNLEGFNLLLIGGALCNDVQSSSAELSEPLGDPTELALASVAARAGFEKARWDVEMPRVAELPFSPERKRMTTVHQVTPAFASAAPEIKTLIRPSVRCVSFTKGAVDMLLDVSTSVLVNGHVEPMTPAWRDRLVSANEALSGKGIRVLGLSFRLLDSVPELDDLEHDLTFVGMTGLMDPPRPEVAAAVVRCKEARIRPVMITGDHPLTAQNIAIQLGISEGGPILTGPELERLTVSELEGLADSVAVYARVSPEHKLKIVEALQRRGHIVAMTGDGVNDAPALKKADIGVAMGIAGTDVAKSAADMVLLDDNFATIVAAVQEGRVIYDNMRKFIRYILATNSGEILLMVMAPFFGMPLPLLPIQILWMNLVTDGLPALAIGLEPAEEDSMRRPPYARNENILGRGMGRHVVWVGILMSALSLGGGYWRWRAGNANWQTMVFTILTLSQMAHVMAIRSERSSLFHIGLMTNMPLLASVLLTTIFQIAVIYVPALQSFFGTYPLAPPDLVLSFALSSVVFFAVELEKRLSRRDN